MSNEMLKRWQDAVVIYFQLSYQDIHSTLSVISLTEIKVTLLKKVQVTYLEEVIKSTDTGDLNSYTE